MNWGIFVEVGMLLAALGLGAIAMRTWRAEGRRLMDGFGLIWDRHALGDLSFGIALASAAMVGIFMVEWLMAAVTQGGAGSTDALPRHVALLALAAFKEEFLMRSLLLSGLRVVLGGRDLWAVALSALAFGLIHLSNPGATVWSVLGNSLGGVIYGLAFVMSGRLWLPLGLHFAWNFVQGPILGFPVSGMVLAGLQLLDDRGPAWLTGGAYGPEAGAVGIAFRFVVIAGVLFWCVFGPRRRAWTLSFGAIHERVGVGTPDMRSAARK
jgi:membrane protease YdiL (CAAX protease family)